MNRGLGISADNWHWGNISAMNVQPAASHLITIVELVLIELPEGSVRRRGG